MPATRPAFARRALRVVLHPAPACGSRARASGGVFALVRRPASPSLSASPRGSTPKLLQSLSCLRRWQMVGLSLICEAQEH